mmetsp:Transcript_7652/g.15576  ORF Transcript_7652/g.15576 Transcript_7652/m.15576 type:complete len:336 (-) Transcript_7652:478-1485(-)
MFAKVTPRTVRPFLQTQWVPRAQRIRKGLQYEKQADRVIGVRQYGLTRCSSASQDAYLDAEVRRGDLRVVAADVVRDSWEVADALSEVFDQEWTWAPGWLPRVIRVLQYSSYERKQHRLQADKTLRLFVPKCADRHAYLVAVHDEPTRSDQHASDESAPNFRDPNRAPVLVTAILDKYLRRIESVRQDSPTHEGSRTQENEMPVVGAICIDTMTEFSPPKRQPRGVPDPDWGPHRYERRKIGYVSNLVVRPANRRQGIGKALLDSAERQAMDWGCRSVGLHCAADNEGALAMYRSAGYRYVATDYPRELVDYPEWMLAQAGVGKTEVFMIKRLQY